MHPMSRREDWCKIRRRRSSGAVAPPVKGGECRRVRSTRAHVAHAPDREEDDSDILVRLLGVGHFGWLAKIVFGTFFGRKIWFGY